MKVTIGFAASLDGFLMFPYEKVHGVCRDSTIYPAAVLAASLQEADCLVSDRLTYAGLASSAFLRSGGKPLVVMTDGALPMAKGMERTFAAPRELLAALVSRGLRHACVLAGAATTHTFFAGRCVDRLSICVLPVIRGNGERLSDAAPVGQALSLRATLSQAHGVVQLVYDVRPPRTVPHS